MLSNLKLKSEEHSGNISCTTQDQVRELNITIPESSSFNRLSAAANQAFLYNISRKKKPWAGDSEKTC